MDRPSTSQQSTEKVEMYQVREHVPYQAELTRAPGYDEESGGDTLEASWDSAWKAICRLYNLIHHMQVAIVVYCMWHYALTSNANGDVTNLQLHIVFAGTGYQLFLVEAILTLHRHNSWSHHLSSEAKGVVHGCLQLIGSIFVMAGTFLALAHTGMTINTAHGICGVIALAFTMISFISGIIALFSPRVHLRIKSGPVKIAHMSLGLFAISMGLVTMTIGFNMTEFRNGQDGLATALMAFVLLILLYVVVQPIIDLVSTTKKEM